VHRQAARGRALRRRSSLARQAAPGVGELTCRPLRKPPQQPPQQPPCRPRRGRLIRRRVLATREPKLAASARGGLGPCSLGSSVASLACNHQLPRLNARGQHAEVVERAAHARWPPRRKAARAWADSLVALGRVDEARAVLLRDFRTSAELARWSRSPTSSCARACVAWPRPTTPARPASRSTSCAAATTCAPSFASAPSASSPPARPLAADLDMRRIAVICPRPQGSDAAAAMQASDRALHLQISAAAKVQAQAQRTLVGCKTTRARPRPASRGREPSPALLGRRAAGPGPLRAAARRLRVQLSAGDVAALLGAELQGELGLDIVTHDELRAWIGETSPAASTTPSAPSPPRSSRPTRACASPSSAPTTSSPAATRRAPPPATSSSCSSSSTPTPRPPR
jgi:hypothetical protein